jgi:hypothetical protein
MFIVALAINFNGFLVGMAVGGLGFGLKGVAHCWLSMIAF